VKSVTIIGGGLAGLTLGIGLRQRGVPAELSEAGHYPRNRVCGEFISGRGQDALERMGLLELLRHAGAITAKTVQFCTTSKAGRTHSLPQPALCLPRREMDTLFAARFRELGGVLHEGRRWRDADGGEGVVFATGRRLQPVVDGWRWFGLKAHARGVRLSADLEMHVSRDGYVGLCRQPGGIVNVCGLFRRRVTHGDSPADSQESLRGPEGSLLRDRMTAATFVPESFCAVAGINLRPQQALTQSECRVGDALTMIPPMTGNGMSIAFESAEVAIEPLAAWSRGETSWAESQQQIARRCDGLLTSRLRWAGWIQKAALSPRLQDLLLTLTSRSDRLWRALFERTR
jgi:menaquinone-9 beta-reductase